MMQHQDQVTGQGGLNSSKSIQREVVSHGMLIQMAKYTLSPVLSFERLVLNTDMPVLTPGNNTKLTIFSNASMTQERNSNSSFLNSMPPLESPLQVRKRKLNLLKCRLSVLVSLKQSPRTAASTSVVTNHQL